MIGRAKVSSEFALVKATLRYGGSAVSTATRVAQALNAVVIFSSFVGLLGVGVVLHTAEALLRLRSAGIEELIIA